MAAQLKLHALAFPYPAQGHIIPMMELCKTLARNGFMITFVVTEVHYRCLVEVQQNNPHDEEQGASLDIQFVTISDGLPLDFDRASDLTRFWMAVGNMGAAFEQLLSNLKPPVSCIITDSFLPWTQDCANKFNIPRALFWTQSALVYSIYLQVEHMKTIGHETSEDSTLSEKDSKERVLQFLSCLPGLPPLQLDDLPYDQTFFSEGSQNWIFQVIQHMIDRGKEAIWILANTFYELETGVIDALQKVLPFYPIGPLLPVASPRTDSNLWNEEQCTEWLDAQAPRSVLYVSFGSVVALPAKQFHELALGLMNSGEPFVWTIRRELYVHHVSEILPHGFLERTKNQGIMVTWTSQLAVLAHQATGAFLSHCGWNSILESLIFGVPILAIPMFGDQKTQARLVAEGWKIGLKLEHSPEDGVVGKEVVERKVRRVMEGEEGREMRKRAEGLRNAARRAMELKGTSHIMLERFMEDVRMKSLESSKQADQEQQQEEEQ